MLKSGYLTNNDTLHVPLGTPHKLKAARMPRSFFVVDALGPVLDISI